MSKSKKQLNFGKELVKRTKDFNKNIDKIMSEVKQTIVYIVIGEVEGVYQDEIGGPFVPHPRKEIVKVFSNKQTAEYFVENCKLSKPKKERYGDTSYYKFGYYGMEIESHEIL